MGNLHTKARWCLGPSPTAVAPRQLHNTQHLSLPPLPAALIKRPVCYGMFSQRFTSGAFLPRSRGLARALHQQSASRISKVKSVNRYMEKASSERLCKHSQCDLKTSMLKPSSLTLSFNYIHTPLLHIPTELRRSELGEAPAWQRDGTGLRATEHQPTKTSPPSHKHSPQTQPFCPRDIPDGTSCFAKRESGNGVRTERNT